MDVPLRSCSQGRRTTGYVRNAPTLASARGTPKKQNYFLIYHRTHNCKIPQISTWYKTFLIAQPTFEIRLFSPKINYVKHSARGIVL
ncbi:MAG: hypothetical protein NZ519_05355 [Bacteroidia bacterium]|nr:hypothetical protein [Bacteroidia bacterium]